MYVYERHGEFLGLIIKKDVWKIKIYKGRLRMTGLYEIANSDGPTM